MTFPITLSTQIAKDQVNLQPLLVLTIDGVPYTFSAGAIYENFVIGAPGLKIGSYNGAMWQIGGAHLIDGLKDYVSLDQGTTTRITQQLQPDKGLGTSVTQMTIRLVDKDQEITQIISPGVVVDEILGKECKVQIGFSNTVYPDDYITIFRGLIEDISSGAGYVTLSLSSSEQKKRTSVFAKATAEVVGVPLLTGSVTFYAATDYVGKTAHGLSIGDTIRFSSVVNTTSVSTDQKYYIISSGFGVNSFKISTTSGGSALNIDIDGTGTILEHIPEIGTFSTIILDDATQFLVRQLGPDGTYDSSITHYVKIGDEYFSYTGTTATTLTGVTRNPSPFNFGTQEHMPGDAVQSMIRLQGNGLDLARKIMFSGTNGYFSSAQTITNFERISGTELVANAIFFEGIDVQDVYGIEIGDYITTSGASNGANNVTLKTISDIQTTISGSYIVVNGVTFVEENATAGTISFRSRWDTLGDGCAMKGFDVDDAEFSYLYSTFLSSFDFDFKLFDTINAKDFIEQQILRPMGCFSIQRKGRVSAGYHIGPIPNSDILVLDENNVLKPSTITIRRSLSKNFYNVIIFNLEKDVNSGEYLITKTTKNQASIDDFNVGQRSMTINADGMTDALQGPAKALQTSNRLLDRYQRGAEYLDNVQVKFGDGFNAEIGDIVIFKTENLYITNISTGDRSAAVRIFQILNKTMDIKSGLISFNLVDTSFSNAARYCLIGPSSYVKSGASGTQFTVEPSFGQKYGANEYLKWQKYGAVGIKVRNASGSVSGTSIIQSWSGNTVTLETSLGFTPAAGYLMELDTYNSQGDDIKFVYGFMRTTAPFDDGKARYQML